MLVSAESQFPKLIAVKLFLRNSNACNHNPPTLQTDGRTDNLSRQRYATLRAVKSEVSEVFASCFSASLEMKGAIAGYPWFLIF